VYERFYKFFKAFIHKGYSVFGESFLYKKYSFFIVFVSEKKGNIGIYREKMVSIDSRFRGNDRMGSRNDKWGQKRHS